MIIMTHYGYLSPIDELEQSVCFISDVEAEDDDQVMWINLFIALTNQLTLKIFSISDLQAVKNRSVLNSVSKQ